MFEKEYPAIHVKVENVGQGLDHYSKVRTASKAGSGGPDVVQLEYQFISSFAQTGDLLDLTPYGAADIAERLRAVGLEAGPPPTTRFWRSRRTLAPWATCTARTS